VVTESNFESIKIGDNTKGPKHFTLIVSLANEKMALHTIVDRCFWVLDLCLVIKFF
jgi:hypothetical protein